MYKISSRAVYKFNFDILNNLYINMGEITKKTSKARPDKIAIEDVDKQKTRMIIDNLTIGIL
ncbi:hypothetical protein P4901_02215 [Escherichia coli]